MRIWTGSRIVALGALAWLVACRDYVPPSQRDVMIIVDVGADTRDSGVRDVPLMDGSDGSLQESGLDGASDVASESAADVPVTSDVAHDSGSDVVAETAVDAPVDVPVDAPVDVPAGDTGPVTCASAGGSCVALTPTSCPAPSMVGDARMYTCGPGLGVECCLPPSDAGTPPSDAGLSGPPVCMHAGTPTEGWYTPGGMLLCTVSCAGLATPMCQRIGTSAQGWYTVGGHGCPPYSTLIVHDATCM